MHGKWSVSGTATATVVSQAFTGFGTALYVVFRNGELLKTKEKLAWDRIGIIIKNDFFTALQQSWLLTKQFMEIFVDASETAIILEGIKYLRIEGSFYLGIGILFHYLWGWR